MIFVVLASGYFSKEAFTNYYVVEADSKEDALYYILMGASHQERIGARVYEAHHAFYGVMQSQPAEATEAET